MVYNRTVRLQSESGVGRNILSLLKSVWISLNSDHTFGIGYGLGYKQLRSLVLNLTSTHQIQNPRGFSDVVEYKQLLIAIVGNSFYSITIINIH